MIDRKYRGAGIQPAEPSEPAAATQRDRHARLISRAIAQLQTLLKQAERESTYGTIGVEVDLRHGLAHVVRMKSTTTET